MRKNGSNDLVEFSAFLGATRFQLVILIFIGGLLLTLFLGLFLELDWGHGFLSKLLDPARTGSAIVSI